MDYKQLLEYVVRPVLKATGTHSLEAEQQLIGTCAAESGGVFIVQLGDGPARGLFQCEPFTHFDIYNNYLRYRDKYLKHALMLLPNEEAEEIIEALSKTDTELENACDNTSMLSLTYNLAYQVMICRIHYLRVSDPLPPAGDIEGMARYWKEHYNTGKGKGDEDHFISNFPGYLWGL